MKKVENVLWGLLLVLLGVIFALRSFGITDVLFPGWWTLFIIIPSLIGFIKNRNKTWSLIWLVVGVMLLLVSWDVFTFSVLSKLTVPIILVIIGLGIIFGDTINAKVNRRIKELNQQGLEEYHAVFSGQKIDFRGEEFKGAGINAIFGGIEFDLRDAVIQEDAVLNIFSVFGGAEVRVPENVNIKVKSTPIFGGVSNKALNKREEGRPTLYINAFCMFGGAEIK